MHAYLFFKVYDITLNSNLLKKNRHGYIIYKSKLKISVIS